VPQPLDPFVRSERRPHLEVDRHRCAEIVLGLGRFVPGALLGGVGGAVVAAEAGRD